MIVPILVAGGHSATVVHITTCAAQTGEICECKVFVQLVADIRVYVSPASQ